MNIYIVVLVAVLSTALAAPLEGGLVKILQPLYKNFHFRREDAPSTAQPIAEAPSSSTPQIAEDTFVIAEDATDRAAFVPAVDGMDGQEDEPEMITEQGDHKQLENCCMEGGLHEQVHDHGTADGETKQDDQEEEQPQNEQQDQRPEESRDSYSIVHQRNLEDGIPEEEESATAGSKEGEMHISRELQPPKQESSWPAYNPLPEIQRGVEDDVETEMDAGDAVSKKPTYSRKDFLVERKFN